MKVTSSQAALPETTADHLLRGVLGVDEVGDIWTRAGDQFVCIRPSRSEIIVCTAEEAAQWKVDIIPAGQGVTLTQED